MLGLMGHLLAVDLLVFSVGGCLSWPDCIMGIIFNGPQQWP